MTIYNFYLFSRSGVCLHYREWKRDKKATICKNLQEMKLMSGLVLSIRSFCSKLSTDPGVQQVDYFKTNQYNFNYYETNTGFKMVLNTDLNATGMKELMYNIYKVCAAAILTTSLTKELDHISDHLEYFEKKLDNLVQNHPSF
ncbi:unnamed protein product [Thelazia callipaeda]|uniref:Trafficking protein particle complex subunit n=1 Tax=Thelazia callipaeda TaxID=103827 RepID=A0A0N5D902_THECL|nr:unnamed protein product [Thelazia callipaeda]